MPGRQVHSDFDRRPRVLHDQAGWQHDLLHDPAGRRQHVLQFRRRAAEQLFVKV
jgi:hypothetical protein